MGREWIKLYTSMLDHPVIARLDDRTRIIFVDAMLLAARLDDDGRIGTIEEVAWALRRPTAHVRAAVAKLEGRITGVDGQLHVRDWLDHQPPKRKPEPAEQVTERTRRFKERQREQEQERGGNATVPSSFQEQERGGNAALELELELRDRTDGSSGLNDHEESEGTSPVGGKAPRKRSARPPKPNFATEHPGAALYRQVIGRNPSRTVYADLDAAFAQHGDETIEFVLHEWVSRGFNPTNVSGILDVLANGWRTKDGRRAPVFAVPAAIAANGNGHLAKLYAPANDGAPRLRRPALAFRDAGIDADPDDVATWPEDVLAAYRREGRVMVDPTGREVVV